MPGTEASLLSCSSRTGPFLVIFHICGSLVYILHSDEASGVHPIDMPERLIHKIEG